MNRVCGRSLNLKAARPSRNDCRKMVVLEVGQILHSCSWYSELNPLSEPICCVCGHDAHRTQSHGRSMLYAERSARPCCGALSGNRGTGR
jgi:hypothetical protein